MTLGEPDYEAMSSSERAAWHRIEAEMIRQTNRLKGFSALQSVIGFEPYPAPLALRHEAAARRILWANALKPR